MADQPTPQAQKARWFRFDCPCGAKGNPAQIDKHGKPYARCPSCWKTIFWADVQKFLSPEPFCRHTNVEVKATRSKAGVKTSWCPTCRIRTFYPPGAPTS
jgi:hypothetical protein